MGGTGLMSQVSHQRFLSFRGAPVLVCVAPRPALISRLCTYALIIIYYHILNSDRQPEKKQCKT